MERTSAACPLRARELWSTPPEPHLGRHRDHITEVLKRRRVVALYPPRLPRILEINALRRRLILDTVVVGHARVGF